MTELYKKHRPRTFKKIVGNEETVRALENMLRQKTLPHTLLFLGPSGCGKTTLARIVKEKLGCHDMDFRELNCSDFRGIDTIRDISRSLTLAPSGGDVRVFLLDEVHQLSKDGQNAALKILEDTPSHCYFFLCTTDPNKLLKTILTRCCKMPVRLLKEHELEKLVKRTARKEKIELSSDSLEDLVLLSSGSARTALVLLDKIANLPEEDREEAMRKRVDEEHEAIELCRALIRKESWSKVSKILRGLATGDPEQIRHAVLGYARTVLLGRRIDEEDEEEDEKGRKNRKKKPKKLDLQLAYQQSYFVIRAFSENFYDSKMAGVVAASYEAIFG